MRLIDLFSGCGGFSLGAHRAGFRVAAAWDIDPILTSSFAYNFPRTRLFLEDVARLDGGTIKKASASPIVGIFGGPPCQGFSDIGRRDVKDPRRKLLGHFFRIVAEVRPSFFIMENVRGLMYAHSREVLDRALLKVRDRYSLFGPIVLDASDFGAATRRGRLFVIGIDKNRADTFSESDLVDYRRRPATVRAALSDLEDAVYVDEHEGFDRWRIAKRGPAHSYARALRSHDGTFTGHRVTEHRIEVARRFNAIGQGEIDKIGRHPRLAWEGQCPTLRAGTGRDLGSYQAVRPLHPEHPRVITVREAARLQGFPDDHRLHPTVWHSFRMIGNSVSPIIAEAIFKAVGRKLGLTTSVADAAE